MEDNEKGAEGISVEHRSEETVTDRGGIKFIFQKYGLTIVLAVFIGYFILFIIGVIAEIFNIQSILDWWIWSSPGKS